MPWSRNDTLMAASVCWSSSAGEGSDAQPATTEATTATATKIRFFIVASQRSALDRRCDRLGALGVDAHVDADGDGGLRTESGIGEALLAIAIVEAQLHAPHLTVADAVGRPSREADTVAGVLAQVGQILQTDALAVFAMAGG